MIGEIIEAPDIVVTHASSLILHASVVDTLTDIFKKVTSMATTIRGAPYKNEYIFTMYLANVNGGLKLVKIKEFIDSEFTSTFFGKTLAPDLGS